MDAFNDVFPQVVSHLNPREHCHTARVCKRLNALIKQLWQRQEHDTQKNRIWITELYLKMEDPKDKLEMMKSNLTQLIISEWYQRVTMPQNDAGIQLIAELGKEGLIKQFSLKIKPAVGQVIDRHQKELLFKSREATLQSFIKYFSLAQIKMFIEWQNDPLIRSVLQKAIKADQLSFAIAEKMSELGNQIAQEFDAQKKLVTSHTEDKLIQELPIPKKNKRDDQLSNINILERQEDTIENRIWCIGLLCEETEYLSSQIEIFKKQIIALEKNNELNAFPVGKIKQSFDQVFNNKFDLIHSTFKESIIEQLSQTLSITEIKQLISLYGDCLGLSVINIQPQIVEEIAIANQKYMEDLLGEIYIELGQRGDDAIHNIFPDSDSLSD